MSLRFTVSFVHNEGSYYLEADSASELVTSIAAIKGGATPAANTPAPTPTETKPGKKSASTDKAAASSPPADSTKADSAASAPTPASSSPAATPAAEPVVDYLKSGIPEKISGYLGDKETGGYAERRAALVALLTSFTVKTAKELKAEQFKDFGAKLDALVKPAEDDLG
jgi:hypothetical protein